MAIRVIKTFLKYTISLGVAGFLFWWVYSEMGFEVLMRQILQADFKWIFLSIFLSFFANIARAYRWNLLLEPLGYRPPLFRTFLALMIGYFANIFAPRLGEITRCGTLKKTDNISFTGSFGTVVTERLVDLLTLVILTGVAFLIEYQRLADFFFKFLSSKMPDAQVNRWYVLIFLAGLTILFFALWLFWRANQESIKVRPIYIKLRGLLMSLVEGLTSISRLKNIYKFVFITVFIWSIYYLMAFVIFFALPETSNLGFMAGYSILIMAALGMSAPVQGGIGTVHALVASVLLIYGVPEQSAKSYAFLLHSSQLVTMLVIGILGLLITMIITKKQTKNITPDGG
ncbi:MAG: lysylphosphatidylglycerol synthase transmembrane domain-containing protein [Bacteroidetes bacterium]|nr:lysylphosphatidylglycerol synthase transmembrane domain-containing protein [Bacteroidota bacterium]